MCYNIKDKSSTEVETCTRFLCNWSTPRSAIQPVSEANFWDLLWQ